MDRAPRAGSIRGAAGARPDRDDLLAIGDQYLDGDRAAAGGGNPAAAGELRRFVADRADGLDGVADQREYAEIFVLGGAEEDELGLECRIILYREAGAGFKLQPAEDREISSSQRHFLGAGLGVPPPLPVQDLFNYFLFARFSVGPFRKRQSSKVHGGSQLRLLGCSNSNEQIRDFFYGFVPSIQIVPILSSRVAECRSYLDGKHPAQTFLLDKAIIHEARDESF